MIWLEFRLGSFAQLFFLSLERKIYRYVSLIYGVSGLKPWRYSKTIFFTDFISVLFMFFSHEFALGMFQHSVRNFCPKIVRNEGKSVQKLNIWKKTSKILKSKIFCK